MEYRPLGTTGLKTSVIGFGAEWIEGMDGDGVRALVDRCVGAGVNIVDCWRPLTRWAV